MHSRTKSLITAFSQEKVDMVSVRQIVFHGMGDDYTLRAICWKLLLRYLPEDRENWKEWLDKSRKLYQNFCEDLLVNPTKLDGHARQNSSDRCEDLSGQDVTDSDHPLNLNDTSQWKEFFKDEEILEQIQRDILRTHPDMSFFSGNSKDVESHREQMQRALMIYAKLNPAVSYVQGMNEIYAPLYYVFKQDQTEGDFAEADAFFCFMDILADFRDSFLTSMDRDSSSGSGATIQRLIDMLKKVDYELWDHLENKSKVNHHYYAFRWTTLLLTQEFQFPDVLRLWDTIFSDPRGRMDSLIRICIAMLKHIRGTLLEGDFTSNLKLLQKYPRDVDVQQILSLAQELVGLIEFNNR
eukprot:TRINITY_DN4400_c0_g1_i1.p1 TRINITY_DN4400_c0_g1~~TRINITY_DN4400_c0_g1_i1.p1  ORF type:complete len:353 (-),score=38.45 TRINITY_DN4400_c0_g1_i1:338-1396(-)